MLVCAAVGNDGLIDPRWGRAERVAVADVVADVAGDAIGDWQEFDVGWGVAHEAGSEARHHARVARFLREHGVEMVVADHMGEGMLRMLETMHIAVRLGASGPARQAVNDSVRRHAR